MNSYSVTLAPMLKKSGRQNERERRGAVLGGNQFNVIKVCGKP